MADERPLTALPSVKARAVAFTSIVLAGICGGLIGWSFVTVQCEKDCSGPGGIGAIVGAVVAAGGVAVVAVLALRAMAEWRSIEDRQG